MAAADIDGTDDMNTLRKELLLLRDRVSALEQSAMRDRPDGRGMPTPGSTAARQQVPAPLRTERIKAPVSFVPPKRPSLESRIGSQWFSRIGIVAVLIGAAWSLKYAVDRQWLGPVARVLIGLASGAGLIAWSERFRRNGFPVFSFSLKALGTGVLYLSLWAAFSLFHLLSYPVAFAGMVMVTVGNAWQCWRQNSEVLAAYAMVGGFLTPALLAQDDISIWALGSYLLLLNAALVWLLVNRRWPRLLPGAFIGTASYLLGLASRAEAFSATAHASSGAANHPWGTLGLASLFFVGFSLLPFAVATMQSEQSARISVAVTVANAVLGSYELVRLMAVPIGHTDWLPIAVAIWFGGLLAAVKTRSSAATLVLVPVLAALAAAFAAIGLWTALPLPGTVVGWALEAACLLLVARRAPGSPPLPGVALLLASAVLLVGASFEPSGAFRSVAQVIWNERFALYFILIAVAVLAVRLAASAHAGGVDISSGVAGLPANRWWREVGAGSSVLGSLLLLLAGILEIHTFWTFWHGAGPQSSATGEQFCISAWAALLGVALLVLGFWVRWSLLRWQALGLLTLAIGKVFLFDTRDLSQGFRILSFLGLGALLLGVSFIYQKDLLHLRGEEHGG